MLNLIQRDAKNAAAAHFRGLTSSAAVRQTNGLISANVIGWGIGKAIEGTVLDTVRVYVRELPDPTIPDRFGDLPTDVVEVGQITDYQNPTDRYRPTPCGVSIGHPDIRAGTLGCLVKKDGNHYILSNNHVLADNNAAEIGDPVIQPGRTDGGTSPDDDIATLEPYQEIDFTGAPNHIDAAIALVGSDSQTIVLPEIIEIGMPQSTPMPASEDQIVRKRGRTTGDTLGQIKDTVADLFINYGADNEAWFEDQILVESVESEHFARGGDSGSLIVDAETLRPVALLFAGSDTTGITIANHIDLVLQHYGVTVVGK